MPATDALRVTQTVILAAGSGSRLGSAELGVPKPLVEVAGAPLIAHALEQARAAGCTRATIVIGHEGARVRESVEQLRHGLDVTFVENPEASAPNGVSLLKAELAANPIFFIQMVDHVFSGLALARLVGRPFEDGELGRVLVDGAPPAALDLADATKVRLERGGRVTAIGKHIEPWDAIDAGCFVLTRAIFDALRAVHDAEPLTVSAGMRRLAERRALGSCMVDGDWVDVDTPADLMLAERLVSAAAVDRRD